MYNMGAGSASPPLPQQSVAGQEIDKVRMVHTFWTRPGLTWIGTIILCLACVFPVWDAYRLMYDAAYVYFMSRYWAICTVVLCGVVVLWYMLAMMVFFKYAWEGFKTEQTVLLIAMVATTMLGLGLLMISVPLRREVSDARNELYMNCEFGTRTQRLYEYSTVLQGIRSTPACKTKDSIDQCQGYQESEPYTGFLKNLETKYHCAGFCWKPEMQEFAAQAAAQITGAVGNPLAPGNASSTGTSSLKRTLQGLAVQATEEAVADQTAQPQAGESKSLLSAIKEISSQVSQQADAAAREYSRGSGSLAPTALLATGSASNRKQSEARARVGIEAIAKIMNTSTRVQPGRIAVFPPTLFSRENYVTSCDGVVARDLKFKAAAIGYSYYLQGTILLFSTIVVGLLRVMMLCGGSKLMAYQWYSDGSQGRTSGLVL